jgi:6-phosphofructokinase 1
MIAAEFLKIKTLGPSRIKSPIDKSLSRENQSLRCISDDDKVLFDPTHKDIFTERNIDNLPFLELAGPRKMIYFDPPKTRCAIVSCGGLCPGLNDVIRGIVMNLHYRYGVKTIYGIRYGYQGFIAKYGHGFLDLTPNSVKDIHRWGGTILGTSRGHQDPAEIVDCLERMSVSILFVIGGDGTIRAALKIVEEIEKRNLKIAIIGIPKTIDNDIMYIDQSFGFETAFSEAVKSITSAHTESLGSPNGIGIVKLMGRHSGFIACYAALAMNDVNFVLIPEVPFKLNGNNGFLNILKKRLETRRHAVIVIAEGAGQDILKMDHVERDASGNIRLQDIGLFLKDIIIKYFASINMEINLKYIDPSYIIRSVPASPKDREFCLRLAQVAVHAAMCGKTEMIVGIRNNNLVHIPMQLAASGRKQVNINSNLWLSVLQATGQPTEFG